MNKHEKEIKDMQAKHDEALQEKMNEHFLHTARHNKEAR